MLEGEAEPVGRATGHREEVGVVRLGEIDDPGVVGEVGRLELGMAVDAETANDEPLEVPGEEVGQPEGRRLVIGHRGEVRPAGEELVAVGAGQALDALLGEDGVEEAAGPAVGVGDEDLVVPVAPTLADSGSDAGRDAALRGVERLAYGMSALIAAIAALMEVKPF